MPPIGRDNPPDLAPEHLSAVELPREPDEGFEAEDAEIVGADISGADARSGRVVHARVDGLRAADATLRDLRLVDVAAEGLDDLRGATLRHVTFADCVLLDTDFGGARLESVRFEGCSLQGTDFSRAEMTEVDLRGSDLSQLGGEVAALRGAIVDTAQLIDLAHPLAAAAGLKVEDGD